MSEPAEFKACKKCGEMKRREDFYARGAAPDGLQNRCKPCHDRACVGAAVDAERVAALKRGEVVAGGASHSEIAAAIGVCRQRVQQIEMTALRKLHDRAVRLYGSSWR